MILTSIGNPNKLNPNPTHNSTSNPNPNPTIDLADAKIMKIIAAEKEYKKTMQILNNKEEQYLRIYRSISMGSSQTGGTGLIEGMEINEIKNKIKDNTKKEKSLEEIQKKITKNQIEKLVVEKKYISEISSVFTPEECLALQKFLKSNYSPSTTSFLLFDEAPLSLSVLLGIPIGVDVDHQEEVNMDMIETSENLSTSTPTMGLGLRPRVNINVLDPPRIFVLDFNGDMAASQVCNLREEISCILQQSNAARGDKVILKLNSGGGTAAGYGLAASQLERLKSIGKLELICCIDEIAASGGYMMACVADTIVASPFAIIGSVGVVATIPMFHERLKREGVEVLDVTAGKYKRTVTPYKQPTDADRQKLEQDLDSIYRLFKTHITTQRPVLAPIIDEIATGEVWCGQHAVDKGLIDGIQCWDDLLLEYVNKKCEVLQLKYVGGKIEEEEERNRGRGFGLESGLGVGSGLGSGLVDKCISYIGNRVLQYITTHVEHSMQIPTNSNNTNINSNMYTNTTTNGSTGGSGSGLGSRSGVKVNDYMVYRGQDGQ